MSTIEGHAARALAHKETADQVASDAEDETDLTVLQGYATEAHDAYTAARDEHTAATLVLPNIETERENLKTVVVQY